MSDIVDSSIYKKRKKRRKRSGSDVVIVKKDVCTPKPKKKKWHHRIKKRPVDVSVGEIMPFGDKTKEFLFSMIGANKDGSRIFCRLKRKNYNRAQPRFAYKAVIEGYYDFDLEKFVITKEHPKLYEHQYADERVYSREEIIEVLKEELSEFDWEL